MTRLLWDALGDVPDRRGRQGRQYELRSVLGIALAAMLAGANDLRAIWRWGRRLRPEALRLFGIESGRSPLPRQLSLLLPGSRRGRLGGDARTLRARRGDGRAHRA